MCFMDFLARKHFTPNLPGSLSAVPQGLESDFVAYGVHALPEAVMLVRHELPVAGEVFERLALELRRMAADIVKHAGLKDEERAVDPRFPGERLLIETHHALPLDLQPAKACRRSDGGDGRDAPMTAVELEKI